MKEKKHIDKVFHDKLKSYEKNPPAEVWQAISGKIAGKNKVIPIGFTWKIAAGMALLIASGLTMYYITTKLDIPESDQYYTKETIPAEIDEPLVTSKEKGPREQVSKLIHKEDADKTGLDDFLSVEKLMAAEYKESIRQESEKTTDREIPEQLTETFQPAGISLTGMATPPPARKDRMPPARKRQPSILEMFFSEIIPEESPKDIISNPWQISAMVAPEYSYRTVKDGPMASAIYFNEAETGLINYSGTLQVGYQISKRLTIQSGLAYSRSGTKIENLNKFELDMNRSGSEQYLKDANGSFIRVANSMGTIVSENPDNNYLSHNHTDGENFRQSINSFETLASSQYTLDEMNAGLLQHLDFIEMPVYLRYMVIDGKLSLNLLGGISSNVLVSNRIYLTTEGGRQDGGRTDNLRSVNLSGNLGLSVDYELSDQFFLLFEPRFKHYLNSINEGRLIEARPYMFGFFTGLRYRF